jgi:hypothetical protein
MPYQNLQTMEIPEEYTITHRDEPFLLYDSGIDSPARILIFSTETNLRALTTTGHWFADGTFKTAPELFYQIYTIHVNGKAEVCICLVPLLESCFLNLSVHTLGQVEKATLYFCLWERSQEDAVFSFAIKMLPAIAFCPVADVVDAFETLAEDIGDDYQGLLDYFEDTYIGRPNTLSKAMRAPISKSTITDLGFSVGFRMSSCWNIS